jgi:hypothetical protein
MTTLSKHAARLRGEEGVRANLACADLRGANLRGANLVGANLACADLRGANLRGAYLRGAYLAVANLAVANLAVANLADANLADAVLRGAVLRGANLTCANLRGANLTNADLRDADLRGANLRDADLAGANLSGTCLDPASPVPPISDEQARAVGIEPDGEWLYGYRSAVSAHVGMTRYDVRDEPYAAHALSLDVSTECHPGIYFAARGRAETRGGVVRVRARRDETVLVSKAKGARARRVWVVRHV